MLHPPVVEGCFFGLLFLLQHWEKLVHHHPETPRGRLVHAASLILSPSKGDQQTLLLVMGGVDRSRQMLSDAWLMSVGDRVSWREVSVLNEK